MKKEIFKKSFSVNLENVCIFAFFVNLYGILAVSGQKREIRCTRYIPPIPGLSIEWWYFTRAKSYVLTSIWDLFGTTYEQKFLDLTIWQVQIWNHF